jgi:hypothetical protein
MLIRVQLVPCVTQRRVLPFLGTFCSISVALKGATFILVVALRRKFVTPYLTTEMAQCDTIEMNHQDETAHTLFVGASASS